jgi:IS5 family transposase
MIPFVARGHPKRCFACKTRQAAHRGGKKVGVQVSFVRDCYGQQRKDDDFWVAMKSPFAPIPLLLLSAPDSELLAFLQEAQRLVDHEPRIIERIEQDLDRHGKQKKALRLEDERWTAAQSLGLGGVALEAGVQDVEQLRLGLGRPRTSGYVVYMFLVGRGYYGGFKSSEAMTLLQESTTMMVFLANQGRSMPGLSTLHELVNAVSNETRELILDAQIREAISEGFDDFSTLLQDSTAVEGNTQWPKDSHLMVDLVARVLRRGRKLDRVGLTRIEDKQMSKLLGKMVQLDKKISMSAGKPGSERERKKLYKKLLRMARRALAWLGPQVQGTEQALGVLNVLPSMRVKAVRLVQWLREDIENISRTIECCEARVMHGRKVPVDQKVLSVSDTDAGFIAKGGREPVVGYKPQLGRSGAGFIVGLIVPRGNAADSNQLEPMFEQAVARTGIVPTTVSVDDGYASQQGRDRLKLRGVQVVSISGSKGKKLTPPEDWNDLDYVAARDGRSAVESLMFTIKHGFDFGRVARRGLLNVRAELLEKVLAYNFCRMASCRRAAAEVQRAAA